MPTEIKVYYCEGSQNGGAPCLGHRCPHYNKAYSEIDKDIPWMPTGFGNAYGSPKREQVLARVGTILARRQQGES